MSYALVQTGSVQRTGPIPTEWKLTDGRWVSGFNTLPPSVWATEGWLPLDEVRPTLGYGQQYGPPSYTIAADKVTATYPVEPIPPPPPSEQTATLAATRILIAPTVRTLDAKPELAELAPLFPEWRAGETVKVADFRTFNGAGVECVQAHTTQVGWEPPVVPALWKQYRAPGAQWVQPLGAQDAYPLGAIVTDAGKTWRSVNAANVWQPPTQWVEVTP